MWGGASYLESSANNSSLLSESEKAKNKPSHDLHRFIAYCSQKAEIKT
jgi:hypothetical protein